MADQGGADVQGDDQQLVAESSQQPVQEQPDCSEAAGSAIQHSTAGEAKGTESSPVDRNDNEEADQQSQHALADHGTKEKKSSSPSVAHSYASLTVEERQARAEKLREQKVLDHRKKESSRRAAFEERRKKVLAEENAKREALLKKLASSSPKQPRAISRSSFGSSTGRPISASTSNLSHLRKTRDVCRSVDITPNDELPKRSSSAMSRPRSSLYLPKRPPSAGSSEETSKSATLGSRPGSRSPNRRPLSAARPQSAFGSSTARPTADKQTKPAIKKNLGQPNLLAASKPKVQDRARSQSSASTHRPPSAARQVKPAHQKTSTLPSTKKSSAADKTPAEEVKKKVIRRSQVGTAITTTTTTTTTSPAGSGKVTKSKTVSNKELKRTEEMKTVVAEAPGVDVARTAEQQLPEIVTTASENGAHDQTEAEQLEKLASIEREKREKEEHDQMELEHKRREEEAERKAKEELERRAAEREHNKRMEEEARQERKKRVEMIMAKVSGKKESPEEVQGHVSPVDPETTKQRVEKILQKVKGQDGVVSPESGEEAPAGGDDTSLIGEQDAVTEALRNDIVTAGERVDAALMQVDEDIPAREDPFDQGIMVNHSDTTHNITVTASDNAPSSEHDHEATESTTEENTIVSATANRTVVQEEQRVARDPSAEEEVVWNSAEQKMIASMGSNELDFAMNHNNSEEGKQWKVMEGKLELSECF